MFMFTFVIQSSEQWEDDSDELYVYELSRSTFWYKNNSAIGAALGAKPHEECFKIDAKQTDTYTLHTMQSLSVCNKEQTCIIIKKIYTLKNK